MPEKKIQNQSGPKAAAAKKPAPEKKATASKKPAAKGKAKVVKQKQQTRRAVTGRPELYTEELAATICERLAIGESLRSITSEEGMPHRQTVFRWLYRYPAFRDQYVSAKRIGMLAYAEDALDIADDGTNDWMERISKDGEHAGWQLNGEHVQRSKLRVDTRKWFMERLDTKVFGQKQEVNHGLQEDNPIMSLIQQVSGSTLKPGGDDEQGGES